METTAVDFEIVEIVEIRNQAWDRVLRLRVRDEAGGIRLGISMEDREHRDALARSPRKIDLATPLFAHMVTRLAEGIYRSPLIDCQRWRG